MKPFDWCVWVELSSTAASFLISHFRPDSLSDLRALSVKKKAHVSSGMTTLHLLEAYKRVEGLKEGGGGGWGCFIYASNARAQLTNQNHSECQFRSFSAHTMASDLEPMKQKKAEVMGLRKSPRGVKPHPGSHPLGLLQSAHPGSVCKNDPKKKVYSVTGKKRLFTISLFGVRDGK